MVSFMSKATKKPTAEEEKKKKEYYAKKEKKAAEKARIFLQAEMELLKFLKSV